MSMAGIVAIFLGVFIVCSRGPLLLAPASTLRVFQKVIATKTRTRVLGGIVALIAVPMIWSGVLESTGLAIVLLIFGIFMLGCGILGLVLFPAAYMSIAESFLPDDLQGSLFGWRMLGLVGVLVGAAIFQVGLDAL